MKHLLILIALAMQIPGEPSHGPYANQPGVKCWRNETRENVPPNPAGVKKLIHCECKLHCDDEGNQREANDCQTYCDNAHTQCLCHSDEACEGSNK